MHFVTSECIAEFQKQGENGLYKLSFSSNLDKNLASSLFVSSHVDFLSYRGVQEIKGLFLRSYNWLFG